MALEWVFEYPRTLRRLRRGPTGKLLAPKSGTSYIPPVKRKIKF